MWYRTAGESEWHTGLTRSISATCALIRADESGAPAEDIVVAGMTNREIATRFSVSEETVKHHLTRMFDKVGASNRLELAMKATQSGFAAPDLADSFR